MKCIYEYRVNGISYKKKLIFRSQGTVSIRYPYEITIYYNPRHPSRGVCKERCSADSRVLFDDCFCRNYD